MITFKSLVEMTPFEFLDTGVPHRAMRLTRGARR